MGSQRVDTTERLHFHFLPLALRPYGKNHFLHKWPWITVLDSPQIHPSSWKLLIHTFSVL